MANVLVVKIKEEGAKPPIWLRGKSVPVHRQKDLLGSSVYKNEIPLGDWRQLAEVLSDLELNGANIEKAFIEFKRKKDWPFE